MAKNKPSDIRDVFAMLGGGLLQPTIEHATEIRGYLDKDKMIINVIAAGHTAIYKLAKSDQGWQITN